MTIKIFVFIHEFFDDFEQFEAEHRVVVQQNLQMLSLRANLDKHTTQNNLNNMKLTRLNGKND